MCKNEEMCISLKWGQLPGLYSWPWLGLYGPRQAGGYFRMAYAHLCPIHIVVPWIVQLLWLVCGPFCAYCFPLVRPSSERSGLVFVFCWVVYIWQPQNHAHKSSSPSYPCSWRAFCGEDGRIRYLHWGCAWAVWSTSYIFFVQVVSHRLQLSGDWPQTPSYLASILAVALLPVWGRVNSGLYRSQSAGASVYPATAEPPLDMLGGEASWVPPGHTVHCWPYQHCCWWTLVTTCYYQVAACLWSYRAFVFARLVSIGCSAFRSGLVHLSWSVHISGILHVLDPLLYQVSGITLVL